MPMYAVNGYTINTVNPQKAGVAILIQIKNILR